MFGLLKHASHVFLGTSLLHNSLTGRTTRLKGDKTLQLVGDRTAKFVQDFALYRNEISTYLILENHWQIGFISL